MSVEAFEAELNKLFDSGACSVVEGYAPFCKHLFVPNFAGFSRARSFRARLANLGGVPALIPIFFAPLQA